MAKIKNDPLPVSKEAEVNRAQIEHRATWMGLIHDEMVKRGIDADDIVREAIGRTGFFHGTRYKDGLKDKEDCVEFTEAFLPPVARETFGQDVTADHDNIEMVFHYCPLVAAWQKLGFDEERISTLCDLAMEGDRGIMRAMGLECDLRETIANGDDFCRLCLSRKNK